MLSICVAVQFTDMFLLKTLELLMLQNEGKNILDQVDLHI